MRVLGGLRLKHQALSPGLDVTVGQADPPELEVDGEGLDAEPAYKDQGLVFPQENGEPLNPEYVSKKFLKLATGAGLPRTRVHDFEARLGVVGSCRWRASQSGSGAPRSFLDHVDSERLFHTLPAMETAAAEQVASLILGS